MLRQAQHGAPLNTSFLFVQPRVPFGYAIHAIVGETVVVSIRRKNTAYSTFERVDAVTAKCHLCPEGVRRGIRVRVEKYTLISFQVK